MFGTIYRLLLWRLLPIIKLARPFKELERSKNPAIDIYFADRTCF